MEVSDKRHAPAALHPGEERQYTLTGKLDGPQNRSVCFGEETKTRVLSGFEHPACPALNLVTTLTELHRLSHK
jgi:hypothetical protein